MIKEDLMCICATKRHTENFVPNRVKGKVSNDPVK